MLCVMLKWKVFRISKNGMVPPDIGKEENEETVETYNSAKKQDEKKKPWINVKTKNMEKKKSAKSSPGTSDNENIVAFERINARLEAMDSLVKNYMERFSALSEQIGEIRAMTTANEKEILKSAGDVTKAIDIVSEVKPEELRIDFQKIMSKVSVNTEKSEALRQLIESAMKEIREIRRREKTYIGTAALLKLNEEVKKDLIEIRKLGYRTKVHADKSEKLFIELRKEFAKNQQIRESIDNIYNIFSEYRKDIDKIKLKFENISSFSKKADFEYEQMTKLVDNSLMVSRGSRDYIDKRILSVLELVSKLSDNLSKENEKQRLFFKSMREREKKLATKQKKDIASIKKSMKKFENRISKKIAKKKHRSKGQIKIHPKQPVNTSQREMFKPPSTKPVKVSIKQPVKSV